MSYLRGPLTREELTMLSAGDARREISTTETQRQPVAEDASAVAPEVAEGVPVRYLDPAAPWAKRIGADPGARTYRAALAARVHLTFDDRHADVDHDEVWESIYHPLSERFDAAAGIAVDHDDRDFISEPVPQMSFGLPEAPIDSKRWFASAAANIKEHLYRSRQIEVLRNRSLKMYGRVGEDRETFTQRCERVADDAADQDVVRLKERFEARIERARDQIELALEKVEDTRLDVESRRQEEMMSGAGTVLGVLLGRRNTRSMSTAASKRSRTKKAERRLEAAQRKAGDEAEDLEELEEDLASAVADVAAEWTDKAADIEVIEIGLEKSDISVADLTLVWLPVR